MRDYIYSVMTDRKKGPVALAVKFFLNIASFFYAAIVSLHRYLYNKGILKTHKVGCRVISVGNITLGGTGKTPFVSKLVAILKQKGFRPAVLIRGYGEDEWRMLKDSLPDTPVIVGRDRVKNAMAALRQHRPDFIVLDDGFQHKRLFRDVNIAVVDTTNPFGNGRLFPRGILREPVDALKEADLIMLSKTDKGRPNIPGIYERIKGLKPESSVLESYHRPLYLVDIREDKKMDPAFLKDKSVCILSGIADPSYFRYTVEKLGAKVVEDLGFSDHHVYRKKDIEGALDRCRRSNAGYMITTEKDVPKLRGLVPDAARPVLALHVELEITKGEERLLERCL